MDTKLVHSLRNKKILITAGPTWVSIDNVRVISNVATGETGILLAEKLQSLGAKVTLLLGPVNACSLGKDVRIINFNFFDELRKKIIKELVLRKYDIIVHNAAVSDFRPLGFKCKIASGRPVSLKLIPLPKITQDIKKLKRKAKTVVFKLESGVSCKRMISRAVHMKAVAGADLVVANKLNPYRAFIIADTGIISVSRNKRALVNNLTKLLVKKP